jgi:SAM-dependent methyltransferase
MINSSEQDLSHLEGFLDILRCPRSGQRLVIENETLATMDGRQRYRLAHTGIPMFAEDFVSSEAETQRRHYNKIAVAYTANLAYPHTREYLAYLDRAVLEAVGHGGLGTLVELCCGRGEALALFGSRMRRYIGIDVSESMLQSTLKQRNHPNAILLQADATHVPLASESVDTVVILGGIHHVPERAQLFLEIARILKPGGRFVYREPVNDFLLWRALRAVIYRLSPMLNHDTERPLRFEETVPVMEKAGLRSLQYRTYGFLGFCLFMNSDVLVFNRLFRFVPGIVAITRASARFDHAILGLPGLRRAGLQVIGVADKPTATRIDL